MDTNDMRKLAWPAYGMPPQGSGTEEHHINNPQIDGYRITLSDLHEPSPVIEIRELLGRLYGTPGKAGVQNPYLANYIRLRGAAMTQLPGEGGQDLTIGTVDFGYWPALNLGYIESIKVSPGIRRKGFGHKLADFAVNHMYSKKIRHVYSFAVNPEGYRLLQNAGFKPELPDDPERPWRSWFCRIASGEPPQT